MKKINIQQQKSLQIDWNVPQWVISDDMVILTTGEHNEDTRAFTGTCLPCRSCPNGKYSKIWLKNAFQKVESSIMFEISNEDE